MPRDLRVCHQVTSSHENIKEMSDALGRREKSSRLSTLRTVSANQEDESVRTRGRDQDPRRVGLSLTATSGLWNRSFLTHKLKVTCFINEVMCVSRMP